MIDDGLDGVDAGTTATMGGCNVEVTHHDSAGDLGGTFTVMTYWQQVHHAPQPGHLTVHDSRGPGSHAQRGILALIHIYL